MKIHAKAIFLGLATDILLSLFVGGLILLVIFGPADTRPVVYIGSLVFGLIATMVGGYVTSRKSPDSKFTNATIFGVAGVLIGFLGAGFMAMPLWFNIASAILIIPAALLGAYIEKRKK